MNKFHIAFVISMLVLATTISSCTKTLKPSSQDGEIAFFIRLPSLTWARFEARCTTEDIFLDQVRIQNPSGGLVTEEFNQQRIPKNEIFAIGNQEPEDGLWLITFIGSSAITNADFQLTMPYEMSIEGTDEGF